MPKNKIKVAILISGRGSNMEALIKSTQQKNSPAEIALVLSNKKEAPGLEIARQFNIKTAFLDHKNFASREIFDQEMSKIIEENGCQLICLAGFMRLLSGWFVTRWRGNLINIHPSLLPAFKGADAVGDAIKYGVKYSGCTVHFVTEEMDSGPIIMQQAVKVTDRDNKESLACKILAQEHIIYPKALNFICKKLRAKS